MSLIFHCVPFFWPLVLSQFNHCVPSKHLTCLFQDELEHADLFLRREMGLDIKQTSEAQLNFTKDEINQYVKRFKSLDYQAKGFITINDLRRYFKVSMSENVSHKGNQALLMIQGREKKKTHGDFSLTSCPVCQILTLESCRHMTVSAGFLCPAVCLSDVINKARMCGRSIDYINSQPVSAGRW